MINQSSATIYVASSEQLEGLILKAVRTIIPELANYQKPAEEASDTQTLDRRRIAYCTIC